MDSSSPSLIKLLNPQTVEECQCCIKAIDDILFDVLGVVAISKAKGKKNLDPMKQKDFLALEYLLTDDMFNATEKNRKQAVKSLTVIGEKYSSVKGLGPGQQKRMNKLVDEVVTGYGLKVSEVATPLLESSMKETMRLTHNSVKKSLEEDLFGKVPAYEVKNEKAIEGMAKVNRVFIHKEYNENQSKAVQAVMLDNLENQGGSSAQITRELTTNLTQYFTKADKNYLSIVSTNMLNNSRSYGALTDYDDVDITEYEILGINDERQSLICKNLSGKTFSVKKALATFDSFSKAKTYEQVIGIKPFLSDEIENGEPTGRMYFKQGEKKVYLESDVESSLLQKYGISYPPFHHRCRSTIVPVY